jgi:trk system potassium uptake protein TrkH
VNWRSIMHNIGKVCILIAAIMVAPMAIAIYDGASDGKAFALSVLVSLGIGLVLSLVKPQERIGRKEGFAIVGLGWIVITIMGTLPFVFSGTVSSYVDAFFEVMSGFTTTGATILRNVEQVPRGILFWRSLTHWLGGMGIIVLSLAIFSSNREGASLFQAEVPGPMPDRILPRLKQTAAMLWIIYATLSLAQIIALKLAGMSLFDSLIHTFGTMATGGFSSKNISVEAYNSPVIEGIIFLFMLLAGLNFSLYYRVTQRRRLKPLLRDPETQGYLGIIFFSTGIIALSLMTVMKLPLGDALRRSAFQVVSVLTTTGFSSDNFDLWPSFAKGILFLLMFIGGCTGSTSGALKVARIILLYKYAKRRIIQVTKPRLVLQTKMGDNVVPDAVIHEILALFFIYIALFVTGALIVMATGEDMMTSITASAATIGNIGPGFAGVGPIANYADMHAVAKWTLSFLMLAGRLEILTIFVMLNPAFWRR